MADEEVTKMSAVGTRLWLHMQEKGPYNRRAFARHLTNTQIYPTNHQNISNWLAREHPPTDFVNAVVKALKLTREEEVELHDIYFRGPKKPTQRNIDAATDIESEEEPDEEPEDPSED